MCRLEDEAIAELAPKPIPPTRHPEAASARHGHSGGIEQRKPRRAFDARLFDHTVAIDTQIHVDRPLPALSPGTCGVLRGRTVATPGVEIAAPTDGAGERSAGRRTRPRAEAVRVRGGACVLVRGGVVRVLVPGGGRIRTSS
jgi:hypothetical protein